MRAPANTARLVTLLTVSGLWITAAAIALVAVGAVTLFLARRLYARLAATVARVVLKIWRIELAVHHRSGGWPQRQVVYISNHPSTLDLFVLVALGLPNTRFFLSGFLQRYIPLGVVARMMGTFFTVPQTRPAERRAIFARADRVLRRTGASVYLSPEGQRVADGSIGAFNKGAFHLAASLRAPIVPLFIEIPASITPGRGYDARPGRIDVHVFPQIDTTSWSVDEASMRKEQTRQLYLDWNRARATRPQEAA